MLIERPFESPLGIRTGIVVFITVCLAIAILAVVWASISAIDLNPIFRGMSFDINSPFPAGSYPFGFVIGAGRLGRLIAIRLFFFTLALGTIASTTIALVGCAAVRFGILQKQVAHCFRNLRYEWYSAIVCALVTSLGFAEWRFLLPVSLLPWALGITLFCVTTQIFSLGAAIAHVRGVRYLIGILLLAQLSSAWWGFSFLFWLSSRTQPWP